MTFHGGPHGILEELRQDVIQRQWDEGEASCYVSVDPHSGRVTVLVLTQTPGKVHPLLYDFFGGETSAYHPNKIGIVFMEGEMVCGQHSDSQTGAQCCIQEVAEDHLILDMSATLPEALGQHGDHIFVVVQQLLHQLTETTLHFLILDRGKVDEHVVGSDIQFMHLQNGGVATNDEGQTTEALDAMGNSYRQLLV